MDQHFNRTRVFIGHRSTYTMGGVGEGIVIVEILSYRSFRNNFSTLIHGTHMAVVRVGDNFPKCRLHTFDFSKRGRHALPLWNKEGGGTERRSVLDGRKLALEGNEGMSTEGILGDGTVAYMD